MQITSQKLVFKNNFGLELAAKLYFPKKKRPLSSVFLVPGLSPLGIDRYSELQRYLAYENIASFTFDFRGHCKSEGNINETTVQDLICDTKMAFKEFSAHFNTPIHVLGYSLGGYIVPKMLESFESSKSILLVSPSAYSDQTDSWNLSENTRNIMKSEYQDPASEIFAKLNKNTKPTLIIFGEEDEKVKPAVIDCFRNFDRKNFKCVFISHGSHALFKDETPEQKEVKTKTIKLVCDFIANNQRHNR